MGVEIGRKWSVLLLLVVVVSTVLCASARPTFFLSEEGTAVAEPRMLRTFFLNDYDKPSANRGHDPGNRMGVHGGGRRH